MAEEEGKTEEGSEEAKPKSKKKLFIIVGVLVVLLGAGIAFPLLSGGSKEERRKYPICRGRRIKGKHPGNRKTT